MTADPKPVKSRHRNKARRIIDPAAVRSALLARPWCVACGGRAGSAHHVIGKGQFGDDVEGNIVGLCGSGTQGCHGALHGNAYTVPVGEPKEIFGFLGTVVGVTRPLAERRDADWVKHRIGEHISQWRPDVTVYVYDKLGATAGLDFLQRVYGYVPGFMRRDA